MFYYVKGKVAHLAPNLAVIDCGGVGYACRTTSYTLSALQVGQEGTLYTHLNVREDAMDLYGFATENERSCFQMLIAISGVGPKAALSILSAANPEGLATAIITGNEKALMVAPGIGKRPPSGSSWSSRTSWPRVSFLRLRRAMGAPASR